MFAAETDSTDFIDIAVPAWAWAVLAISVVSLLAIDLWRHRKAHAPSFREAGIESAVWVAFAVAFGVFMLWRFGAQAGGEYFGVYLTEKSLSVDNVFVWSLLFSSMAIPLKYQHRVLFWGIFGALTLRSLFIVIGAELVERFAVILVFFGVFLVYTGIKIIRHTEGEGDGSSTAGLNLLRRLMPVTDDFHGQKFLTNIGGKRHATPLLAALVVVEATDVIFAVDSVPASFGVANDPYILISANAFAIMGLRAMYFLLADAKERLHFLSHALGAILLFVGVKLIITPWYHVPITWSLGIIVTILVLATVLSLTRDHDDEHDPDGDPNPDDGDGDDRVETRPTESDPAP